MMVNIITWLNEHAGIASWLSGSVTTIGLISTRMSFRSKAVVDILATYKQVSADSYIRVNHIIALTNIGNTPVIPKEFGYVAFHKMEKIYMPLITNRIDGAVQPYQKIERGSQVAYVEDILDEHGFTRNDNDIKVKAYVKIHTGKIYYSKNSINLNMNKLDEDGEKIADMIANGAINPEELLPQSEQAL